MFYKHLNITILTDQSSWMKKFDEILAARLLNAGHQVRIITSRDDLHDGDVAFFLSCFEIVHKEYLKLNKHNIVVHASALPQGKGWSPTTWQILEGKNDIPLTLFEATEEVDAGCIYLRDTIHLAGFELISDWQEALGNKIVAMCEDFVLRLSNGAVVGKDQIGGESFYGRRKPSDSELDIEKSVADQFNLLRVVDNEKYPAYFIKDGHKYILKIYRQS